MENKSSQEQLHYLFESIGYKNNTDVRDLIDNIDFTQSILFVNKSIEYAYNKGLFSMIETEILSKSLHIINSKIFELNDKSGQRQFDNEDNSTSND